VLADNRMVSKKPITGSDIWPCFSGWRDSAKISNYCLFASLNFAYNIIAKAQFSVSSQPP
jgi:hypothetical protein